MDLSSFSKNRDFLFTESTYPSPADPDVRQYLDSEVWLKTIHQCRDNEKARRQKNLLAWPYIHTREELRVPLFYIHQYFTDKEKQTVPLEKNRFHNTAIQSDVKKKLKHDYFRKLTRESAVTTLGYMIQKLGDFVFYAIKDNKLVAFVRYFDPEWTNDWTRQIVTTEKPIFKNWKKEMETLTNMGISDRDHWRPEGCAAWIRSTNSPGYKGFFVYLNYFLTLCDERKVPDTIGFLNLYEHPMLREDNKEPFPHFYMPDDRVNFPPSVFPILSSTHKEEYIDLILPVIDQWEYTAKLFFPKHCRNYYYEPKNKPSFPWNGKIGTLLFRGSITGCFSDDRNPRIKLIKLSEVWEKDPKFNDQNPIDQVPFLNAKIVSVSAWDSVECYYKDGSPDINCSGDGYGRINVHPETLKKFMDRKAFIPQWKQPEYKYLLSIEGSVAPWREPFILSSGSTMVRAETPYKMWYEPLIKPLEHYVPLDRNLSKLSETIAWCKTHDQECKKISEQAKQFYQNYLDREASLDYLQLLLVEFERS